MHLIVILDQGLNGRVRGGYCLLIALVMSLIFSVGGVVNRSHGAFYALGAYVSVEISRVLGFVPAIVLSPVAVGLIGVLFDRFILRRFYTADPILSLLVTFGLAMVAEQLKIGRASCRERVCQYVSISGVAVSLKKKT